MLVLQLPINEKYSLLNIEHSITRCAVKLVSSPLTVGACTCLRCSNAVVVSKVVLRYPGESYGEPFRNFSTFHREQTLIDPSALEEARD